MVARLFLLGNAGLNETRHNAKSADDTTRANGATKVGATHGMQAVFASIRRRQKHTAAATSALGVSTVSAPIRLKQNCVAEIVAAQNLSATAFPNKSREAGTEAWYWLMCFHLKRKQQALSYHTESEIGTAREEGTKKGCKSILHSPFTEYLSNFAYTAEQQLQQATLQVDEMQTECRALADYFATEGPLESEFIFSTLFEFVQALEASKGRVLRGQLHKDRQKSCRDPPNAKIGQVLPTPWGTAVVTGVRWVPHQREQNPTGNFTYMQNAPAGQEDKRQQTQDTAWRCTLTTLSSQQDPLSRISNSVEQCPQGQFYSPAVSNECSVFPCSFIDGFTSAGIQTGLLPS